MLSECPFLYVQARQGGGTGVVVSLKQTTCIFRNMGGNEQEREREERDRVLSSQSVVYKTSKWERKLLQFKQLIGM